MTKPMAETAFDVVSKHLATNGAREQATHPPLDTRIMHNNLIRISDNIDDVISHVEHLNPERIRTYHQQPGSLTGA